MKTLLLLALSLPVAAMEADVAVYGATPSGIAAAVNAARSGRQVVLLEESSHIGGLTSGGLSNTDFKHIESVQGTFREFMNGVVAEYAERYGANSEQVRQSRRGGYYEPKIALAVFEKMLGAEKTLKVLRRHRLTAAMLRAGRKGRSVLTGARFENLQTGQTVDVFARAFIDATYEGDLMAAAGVPYTVGRESRSEYGELFAGRKFYSGGQFLPGSSGEGDSHVQCYNFRITMTNDPANRVDIVKPAVYRREEYAPLLDWMRAGKIEAVAEGVVRFRYLPNRKADVNDVMHAPISLRLLAENDEWPEGSPEVRQKIFERFRNYSLGLFWFLANDPEVPGKIRREAREWGLPRDEFPESGHFPPVLYVREGRRMLGEFVYTERDTQPQRGSVRAPLHQDSIAVGDYSIDSHGELPPTSYHPGVTDGSYGFATVPFQAPYRILIPPNVDGLLVSCAFSASHVGYSALRMEPTWTAIGQAAGIAAAISATDGTPLRDIDVSAVQDELHRRGAITVYFSDVTPASPFFKSAQYFGSRGYFHDLIDPSTVSWSVAPRLPESQWRGPAPLHEAALDQPLTEEARIQWTNRAGVAIPPGTVRRGEFLQRLYEAVRR